jgi:DNA primase
MDGDAAGQKAADRAIEVFMHGDLDVSIAILPDGQDPDELLQAGGLEAWQAALDSAVDALSFEFSRLQAALDNANSVTGRQRVTETFLGKLLDMGFTRTGSVRRSLVIRQLASLLHLSESELDRWFRDRSTQVRQPVRRPDFQVQSDTETAFYQSSDRDMTAGKANDVNTLPQEVASGQSSSRLHAVGIAEKRLMACLIRDNSLFTATLSDGSSLDEAISPEDMCVDEHQRLFMRMYETLANDQPISLAGLLGDLAQASEHGLIRVATAADEALDRLDIETYQELEQALTDAADAVLKHRREQAYARDKSQLKNLMHNESDADDAKLQLLRRMHEHHQTNPSPVKIARVS